MPLAHRLKLVARPVVHAMRRARMRLDMLLRPPRPWDGTHHPVLAHFPPWKGEADGVHAYDFLGIKTDPRFRVQFRPHPPGPLETEYPVPHPAYFELVFVLESVLAATDRYTFMELGAGYGPWMVTAWKAMAATAALPVQLIGVEMVVEHFTYMQQHFRNNGIDPDRHTLIQAAVSDREGVGLFLPETDARLDYGQSLVKRAVSPGLSRRQAVQVPCVGLSGLLRDAETVDMIHMDVQGEELRILEPCVEQVSRQVRRLLVATHSRANHKRIRELLLGRGWSPVHDFGLRARERTPFGDVRFLDGLLAFVNPRAA